MGLNPRAVIFDMDGLLLDSEPLYRMVWKKAAAELGCPIGDELYTTFVGRGSDKAEQLLSEHFGEALPLDEFRIRWHRYFDERLGRGPIATKPGAIELLDFLDASAIPTALATSSRRLMADRCLGDLAARFAVITSGDEVEEPKPDPHLFLLTSERLGVEPERCLVLEDSDAGVRAARNAGMEVILVPDWVKPSAETVAMATHVCKSLAEIPVILSRRSCVSEGGAAQDDEGSQDTQLRPKPV
jgi:HAD superfamily hydrolase (TIGR01509 family)